MGPISGITNLKRHLANMHKLNEAKEGRNEPESKCAKKSKKLSRENVIDHM